MFSLSLSLSFFLSLSLSGNIFHASPCLVCPSSHELYVPNGSLNQFLFTTSPYIPSAFQAAVTLTHTLTHSSFHILPPSSFLSFFFFSSPSSSSSSSINLSVCGHHLHIIFFVFFSLDFSFPFPPTLPISFFSLFSFLFLILLLFPLFPSFSASSSS